MKSPRVSTPSDNRQRVEVLWQDFGTSLRRFFSARGASPEDAEDLVGETFLRVQGALDTLRDDDRAGAWIGRIARNVWIDARRRRTPEPSDLAAEDLPAPESSDPTADFARWLSGVVDELDPLYAEPLRRFDLAGQSQQDIAAALGLSLTATKSRIRRGREQVRRRFDACCTLTRDRRGGILDVQRRPNGTNCDC
jgi:RNA polymerase sigma-70 factor, ECF subfamily